MSNGPVPETGYNDVASFRSGMLACHAEDPPEHGGEPVVTTTSSPWLSLRCTTCNQTFRRGDLVRVAPNGQVQHQAPELRCAVEEPAGDAPGAADVRAFAAGIRAAQALSGPAITILSAGDWQVARRDGLLAAHCAFCGHTFRAGDGVIICPCAQQTDQPPVPGCGLTVHQDPVAGLECWRSWRQAGDLIRCPVVRDRVGTSGAAHGRS
jgi:hypothetical protein